MNIDDVYDGRKVSELIAEGEYKSSKEEILRGFKIFQKKYVYKSVAVQMTLVVLAIITQLVNIVMGADRDVSFSWMLVVFCVILGGYLFTGSLIPALASLRVLYIKQKFIQIV